MCAPCEEEGDSRKELAHIFGRYFEVDDSFVKASNLIAMAQLGLYMAQSKAPVNEVRFPAYEAENPQLDSYLYVKDSDLRKTFARIRREMQRAAASEETSVPDAHVVPFSRVKQVAAARR